MRRPIPAEYLVEHYPSRGERLADHWVHVTALAAATIATVVLIAAAFLTARPGLVFASALYGVALIAMLAFSAVYNLTHISAARPFLRRLDEAGIFLMIAGSYTPFTTQRLHGAWAWSMTTAVWVLAAAGIVGKLTLPRVSEKVWTAYYISFGWVAAVALKPLSAALAPGPLLLLIAGGVVYTAGAVVFLNERLRFRRAIWHGFVCAGASVHYAAILAGVVLAPMGR
jgi:hemolysin III